MVATGVLVTRPVAPSCGRLYTVITEPRPPIRVGGLADRRCTDPAQDRLLVALALVVLGVGFVAGAVIALQRRNFHTSPVFYTVLAWVVLLVFAALIGLYFWVDEKFALKVWGD